MIKTNDLHWTAGFLEGEGSFGRYSKGNSCLRIRASQVQLAPLHKLQALFGGRLSSSKPRAPFPYTAQPISEWALVGRKAAALMMTLYCLMSPRRQAKIEELLLHWRQFPVDRQRDEHGRYKKARIELGND
jgi:hypothetical protein